MVGEGVAAIVADSFYAAEDARELIEVDYERLACAQTLVAEAPAFHEDLPDTVTGRAPFPRESDAASKAANRNPTSDRSFYIGAKALDQLGKTELSLNWLQRAIALNVTSSESWYLLARVYRKLRQNDKAEEAQQRFLELKAKKQTRRQ